MASSGRSCDSASNTIDIAARHVLQVKIQLAEQECVLWDSSGSESKDQLNPSISTMLTAEIRVDHGSRALFRVTWMFFCAL